MYEKDKHSNLNILPKDNSHKLQNLYIHSNIPIKRNSLSSKSNNNNQGGVVLISDLIDINKRNHKVLESMSHRSVSLNKPNSRSAKVSSRQTQERSGSGAGLPLAPKINNLYQFSSQHNQDMSGLVANFPSSVLNNKNLIPINNIHNIKFDQTDEISNLVQSFKPINYGFHPNHPNFPNNHQNLLHAKLQPLANGRSLLSGNSSSSKNQQRIASIIPADKLNLFKNSISINHLDLNHASNVNAKKPHTTTKLEVTSNFFFNNTSVKEYACKEEQNPGCRKTMEDYTRIVENFQGEKSRVLFCLFDGHGGSEVAKHLKEKLPEVLAKMLSDTKLTVETSITKGFKLSDEDFKSYQNVGSTACVVYITVEKEKRVLYSANVGDSRVILVKNNKSIRISYDHKCTDGKESDRIKQSGGIIFGGRVFGQLALTRSFGDFSLKNYGVCPTPFINKHFIQDDDKYVILGSDGIWDVVDEEQVHKLSQTITNSDEFCKLLVKTALASGSIDNISCIVAKLN